LIQIQPRIAVARKAETGTELFFVISLRHENIQPILSAYRLMLAA
jgi:hypothetical protein